MFIMLQRENNPFDFITCPHGNLYFSFSFLYLFLGILMTSLEKYQVRGL